MAVQYFGASTAGALLPGWALAEEMLALERAGETTAGYPPALTGLRGSHVGSFETARREFLRLLVTDRDQMPEIPVGAKARYLYTISYRDFLIKHLDIHESEVFAVLQDLPAKNRSALCFSPMRDLLQFLSHSSFASYHQIRLQ